ncbi:MAG: D-alanyl-D-alanine carboxypeptidase family protein [Actinomycetota bacterium]|nr:D-alanyl-D-alanine carboxypeptidase family protein [Actinomycetota bacterium]MDP3630373.1 D-alanyl-D-alanine carboxypeptidase family protein [Actinomycetota bacterium]
MSWFGATVRDRRVLALLLVLIAFSPGRALGEVRPTDTLGEVSVASSKTLTGVAPDVTLPSGILETADGELLWARAQDEERSMASTTKIMTAIVVLDSGVQLDERVTVPSEAARVGEAGVGLVPGQELTVRQLLEAMLVHSGNDAAITLAVHTSGSLDVFVEAMNAKAVELDLRNSTFTNPHGLDEPGHHTSAADLATMARYAMRKQAFRDIVQMKEVRIPVGSSTRRFEASNLLLGTFNGATGIKTGWTSDAGYCLVASAERDGIELFAVVLGTKTENARFVQAKRLLDWGFSHYAIKQVTSAEQTASIVAVTDYLDRTVPAVVAETTSTAVYDIRGPITVKADVVGEIAAPVSKGQRLGTLTVEQAGRLLAQVPIVAARSVPVPTFWEAVQIGAVRLWRKLFGGALQAVPVTVM